MNRLSNFLQSDLKKVETSFESIKDIIDYKINYESNSILEKDLERIESFIIYWGHHAKKLK
jgi:hypothetical protein